MAGRGAKFGGQTDLSQLFHQPMAALGYFFGVMIVGRDAGKAEELVKIFEMTCAHGLNVSDENALVIPSRGGIGILPMNPPEHRLGTCLTLPRQVPFH